MGAKRDQRRDQDLQKWLAYLWNLTELLGRPRLNERYDANTRNTS